MFSTTGPGMDEVISPALGEGRRSIPARRLVDGGTRMCGGAGSREYIEAVLLGTAPGPRYVFVFVGAGIACQVQGGRREGAEDLLGPSHAV